MVPDIVILKSGKMTKISTDVYWRQHFTLSFCRKWLKIGWKERKSSFRQELMNQWTPGYCCNFLLKIIKEKHIFEQDEGGLSQIIYLTPLWVIFTPSVTFEPLCTFMYHFMQNIRKKIWLSLLGHFEKLSKQSILGPFWANDIFREK